MVVATSKKNPSPIDPNRLIFRGLTSCHTVRKSLKCYVVSVASKYLGITGFHAGRQQCRYLGIAVAGVRVVAARKPSSAKKKGGGLFILFALLIHFFKRATEAGTGQLQKRSYQYGFSIPPVYFPHQAPLPRHSLVPPPLSKHGPVYQKVSTPTIPKSTSGIDHKDWATLLDI